MDLRSIEPLSVQWPPWDRIRWSRSFLVRVRTIDQRKNGTRNPGRCGDFLEMWYVACQGRRQGGGSGAHGPDSI